jgi:hypothetical protein
LRCGGDVMLLLPAAARRQTGSSQRATAVMRLCVLARRTLDSQDPTEAQYKAGSSLAARWSRLTAIDGRSERPNSGQHTSAQG